VSWQTAQPLVRFDFRISFGFSIKVVNRAYAGIIVVGTVGKDKKNRP